MKRIHLLVFPKMKANFVHGESFRVNFEATKMDATTRLRLEDFPSCVESCCVNERRKVPFGDIYPKKAPSERGNSPL